MTHCHGQACVFDEVEVPLLGCVGEQRPYGMGGAGAKLRFLPPYSPDFNPIELAFSKIKALLKKAAARTLEDLWEAIRNAINAITPTDCRSFFTATGYEPE